VLRSYIAIQLLERGLRNQCQRTWPCRLGITIEFQGHGGNVGVN